VLGRFKSRKALDMVLYLNACPGQKKERAPGASGSTASRQLMAFDGMHSESGDRFSALSPERLTS